MGSVGFHQSELYHLTMKFLVLASSVLAAVSGFYHAPYAAVGHVYGLKSAPCVNAANVPVPCAAGYYGKRDADADAAYVYGVPFGSSTGLDPITQGLDPVTQGYAPYAAYGYPYAAHYGKREAEADAQVVLPYAGYGYAAPHGVAAT